MKKFATLILITLTGLTVCGQTNKIESTGNVGIGTLSPSSLLSINLNGNENKISALQRFENNHVAYLKFGLFGNLTTYNLKNSAALWSNNRNLALWAGNTGYSILFSTGNSASERMRIDSNGNVGIGTISPSVRLDVAGEMRLKSAGTQLNILRLENATWSCNQEMAIEFWNGTGYKNVATSRIVTKMHNCGDGGEDLYFQTQSPDSNNPNQTQPTTKLFIEANGDIGIGTITPEAKLDVAGTIKAQEIEVTLASIDNMQLNGTLAANNITLTTNGQTADFVFEPDYQLKDLSEVETYIKTNNHLPDIPSAAELVKDGVNLAEMNKLLLQKIEELTLYAIEQKEEVEKMKEVRNKEVEVRKALEKRLAKIEAMLSNNAK